MCYKKCEITFFRIPPARSVIGEPFAVGIEDLDLIGEICPLKPGVASGLADFPCKLCPNPASYLVPDHPFSESMIDLHVAPSPSLCHLRMCIWVFPFFHGDIWDAFAISHASPLSFTQTKLPGPIPNVFTPLGREHATQSNHGCFCALRSPNMLHSLLHRENGFVHTTRKG